MCTITTKLKKNIIKEIHSGDIEQLKQYKDENPDFHWNSIRYDQTGDTILHSACQIGFVPTILYLIDPKLYPNAVNCKNKDDKTPLHVAAQFSHPEVVEILIKNGAEVNVLKRADWTPLMLACTKMCPKTVNILLENGALVDFPNKDKWTSLHLTARYECINNFYKLLKMGADPNLVTKNGRTALHIAALHGFRIIAAELIRIGVEIDAKDNCGNTALHEAALGGYNDVFYLLIRKGADIRTVNNVGFNLFHSAASSGHRQLFACFKFNLKFDLNAVTANGWTVLHCAARNNQKNAFNHLVSLGADPNLTDLYNRKPSDYFPN